MKILTKIGTTITLFGLMAFSGLASAATETGSVIIGGGGAQHGAMIEKVDGKKTYVSMFKAKKLTAGSHRLDLRVKHDPSAGSGLLGLLPADRILLSMVAGTVHHAVMDLDVQPGHKYVIKTNNADKGTWLVTAYDKTAKTDAAQVLIDSKSGEFQQIL